MEQIRIRLEEPSDHRVVEELTRVAFWDRYQPGFSEHLILHRFRDHPDFILSLSFVAKNSDRIVGHIMYSRSAIHTEKGIHPTITFGPVSVLPEFQDRASGKR